MRHFALLISFLCSFSSAHAHSPVLSKCLSTYEHFFPHCDPNSSEVALCVKSSLEGLYLRDVLKYQPQPKDPSVNGYERYKRTSEYRVRLAKLMGDRKDIIGAYLCLPSKDRWVLSQDGSVQAKTASLSFIAPQNSFKKFEADLSISSEALDELEATHTNKIYFFRLLSFFRKDKPVKTRFTHVFYCTSWSKGVCEEEIVFKVSGRGTLF